MRIDHQEDYRDRRRADYPDIVSQLDVLWNFMAQLAAAGTDIGSEATAMLAQIQATKQKYPKPATK